MGSDREAAPLFLCIKNPNNKVVRIDLTSNHFVIGYLSYSDWASFTT